MGDVEEHRHPYTGQLMLLRTDVVKPEMMTDFSTFESAMDETAPSAYYIPATLVAGNAAQNARLVGALADKLAAHGIRFTRLSAPTEVPPALGEPRVPRVAPEHLVRDAVLMIETEPNGE
jgi:hypothetical protein